MNSKRLSIICIILFGWASALFGASEFFTTKSNDNYHTVIEFNLPEYRCETAEYNGKQFQKISLPNEGELIEVGKPHLPLVTRLIAIPNQGLPRIELTITEEQVLHDITVFPYQPSSDKEEPFAQNIEFYQSGKAYPSESIVIGETAILRDMRVAPLTIYPFQYDPLKSELKIIKKATIEVYYSNSEGGDIKAQTRAKRISRFFEPLYEATIINYEAPRSPEDYQQASYLFIYPDNDIVENLLQYLIDWKHQKGFNVVAASTEETGNTVSLIKSYIQNAYDTWDHPPEFICLVGDAGGSYNIPTYMYSSGEGDHYYTLLEGNDILADAFIGRLSFNTIPELQTIITKILNYEKQPYMDETNWYRNALLVGDPSSSGYSCIAVNKYIKEIILDHNPNFSFSEVYSSPFVSEMSLALNAGVSYFNYRGWLGMSGWDNSDTDNLNNGLKLPFVMIPTCGTGDFAGTSDCESERFLKAGTPTNPKGAIAAIGAATLSTHTAFNNCISGGSFYGIFVDNIYYTGAALTYGKYTIYANYPNNPNDWVNRFSYWYNLMGDPGSELWTDIPRSMNLEYETSLPVGSNYFLVNVTNQYNMPIGGAWVTVTSEDDTIFSTGYTDSGGEVALQINTSTPKNCFVTVTKHNFIPHIGEFEIVYADYFASSDSIIIDDDNSGLSQGNGNGAINPGETIELQIGIRNNGNMALHAVSATLSSENTELTLINDNADYGDISAGEMAFASEDFAFAIDPSCLGNTLIQFDLLIEDSENNEWIDKIFLTVKGPYLEPADYTVIDGEDGILEPGETANLTVTLSNLGSESANDITGILQSSNSNVTILDSIGYWGTITSGEEANNSNDPFQVSIDTQAIPGTPITFQIHLTTPSGYDSYTQLLIDIGNVMMTDPLGPDEYGYYCYDSGDTGYDIAPQYLWMEIDPNYGGAGTVIPLTDGGNTSDISIISLPFNIKFYGLIYSSLTICSDGWVAPGETEQTAFMNWHIPGPLGPSPMIAPFWDDLKISGGRVCYYYDEALHYFILEWSHLQNEYNNLEETFQVILTDPAYHPTPTGDSDIIIQYKVVNNVDQGSYSTTLQHGQYATVGIEDHTSFRGLEYTYNNTYPTAAKPLENNMALLFTTRGTAVLPPPEAVVSPTSFFFLLNQGENTTEIISISNEGGSDLIFSINKNYNLGPYNGGPDGYGYYWVDSDEPQAAVYDWIDISDIGTQVNFSHNDYAAGPFEIGFDFPFYGESYNEFIINPNGWIGFGEDWTDYHNYSIPRVDAPKPAIFGFWDDLDPLQGGDVYYYSNNIDSLIIWYDDVIHYPGTWNGTYNFEIILTKEGKIKYQYKEMSGDLNSATIGIQNETGTIGLEVAYDENYVHNELAVDFFRYVDWLSTDPVSGVILPGEEQEVILEVDASDLDTGDYVCDLQINTNDPENSQIIIPVNLNVGNGDTGYLEGFVTLVGGPGPIENVEIVITNGEESFIVSPDTIGYFIIELEPGTYSLTAILNGYEPATMENIIIESGQTTSVEITLFYIEMPSWVWVTLDEYYTAIITWNDVLNNAKKNGKEFESYTLLRRYNEEDWEIIEEGLSDTTHYDSLLWQPDGGYQYGVKSIYTEAESDTTFSETFSLFRFVPTVTLNITDSGGFPLSDVRVTMQGLDSIYAQVFSGTSDGSIQFENVYMVDYLVRCEKDGYISVEDTITITADSTEFWFVLNPAHSIPEEQLMPSTYGVSQNFPNPFGSVSSPSTKIKFQLPESAGVTIFIYNIKGELVRHLLINEPLKAGYYTIIWDGTNDAKKTLGSGMYFYRIQAGDKFDEIKKCILLR